MGKDNSQKGESVARSASILVITTLDSEGSETPLIFVESAVLFESSADSEGDGVRLPPHPLKYSQIEVDYLKFY